MLQIHRMCFSNQLTIHKRIRKVWHNFVRAIATHIAQRGF